MRRIDRPHSNSARWLPFVALASGALLVLLVGAGLVRANADAGQRERLAARTAAHEHAQELHRLLRLPSALDRLPSDDRFAVAAGAVVVPDELGWLSPRPTVALDPVTAGVLQGAKTTADAGEAAQALTGFLAALPADATAIGALRGAAAWSLHRAGDAAARDAMLGDLDAALVAAGRQAVASPSFQDVVIGAALLHAAATRTVPTGLQPLLTALPEERIDPVFARLREHGADLPEVAHMAHLLAGRRARLRAVQDHLPRLGAAPTVMPLGERLLFWFPDATNGQGALVPPTATAAIAPQAWRSHLAFTAGIADAEPVVDGLVWVVPATPPPPPWLARPEVVLTAAAVLIALCAGSGWLSLRAFRRHANAVRTQAEFLTVVTHELKTPVASIRLMAEVLGADEVPVARQPEYFALLAGEAARLQMLIENVLDLGQRERGERAFDRRSADVAALVRDALTLFTPLAARAGLSLGFEPPEVPALADVDSGALQQALLNVLDNARKYAASGGRIVVTLQAKSPTLRLVVRDFGPGVPADEQASIFERFRRGRAHRHGSIPGVGIGLHLAREILRRHDGELHCQTPADEQGGAEFVFDLPMRRDPEETRP